MLPRPQKITRLLKTIIMDTSIEIKKSGAMTFWDHLEELRWALLRTLVVLVVLLIGFFLCMHRLFDEFVLAPTTSDFFLYRWLSHLPQNSLLPDFGGEFHVDIINIEVTSQFMTHLTTSFWFALVASFPYLMFEMWRFVQPALYKEEKLSVSFAFALGTVMFYIGCLVSYCIIFPFTFRFLTEYELSSLIVNQISLDSYMGNFLMLIFIMGLVFELPLLAWLLSKLGILRREFLTKYRRQAIVLLLVLAAIITPTGDPFTLMLVFLPLYCLYEMSIRFVRE